MDRQLSPLPALVAAADDAYQVVRVVVIDQLPPGAHIDMKVLTPHQRQVLDALSDAEAALARYRQDAYAAVSC